MVCVQNGQIGNLDAQNHEELAKANLEGIVPGPELPRVVHRVLHHAKALLDLQAKWQVQEDCAQKTCNDNSKVIGVRLKRFDHIRACKSLRWQEPGEKQLDANHESKAVHDHPSLLVIEVVEGRLFIFSCLLLVLCFILVSFLLLIVVVVIFV